MRRSTTLLLAGTMLAVAPAHALARPEVREVLTDVAGLAAVVGDDAVELRWRADSSPAPVRVVRGTTTVATLPAGATSYDDRAVAPASTHSYRVVEVTTTKSKGKGKGAPTSTTPVSVSVRLPDHLVGAAVTDITPAGVVNLGGNGLGDGRLIPQAIVGRGGTGSATRERIRARAMVVDDGVRAVAIANIETQGWFAAYQDGPYGLQDMAAEIARRVPRLPAASILLASDHTHSGPDTIGAWGGVSEDYLRGVRDQVVAAVVEAYRTRSFADLRGGESDASDLVYNQSCTEGLNQSREPVYPGPDVCATPGKDGMLRALQASTRKGRTVVTFVAYAAHATAGGGEGLHGDWPQFLSDELSRRYGGVGLAMVGALGGTQPCRPACAFTKATNPGYDIADRKTAIVTNYARHVQLALAAAKPVRGPVGSRQAFIREPLVGPAVTALFAAGEYAGARLLRNHESPWVVGQSVRTVVTGMRIGDVAIAATPGEGFPAIRALVDEALGAEARMVVQLGLAGDQLGYLISPAAYVPVIAAQVPVNDNIIFNVSPTIGDHVACADARLLLDLFPGTLPAQCAPYAVEDAAGDPLGTVPVGGVVLPGPPG